MNSKGFTVRVKWLITPHTALTSSIIASFSLTTASNEWICTWDQRKSSYITTCRKPNEHQSRTKCKNDFAPKGKRYLKVSVNVTQLCYSPLKLVCLHGDLEVLRRQQRGVRTTHSHPFMNKLATMFSVSYLWRGECFWCPVKSGHWFHCQPFWPRSSFHS